MKTLVWKSDSEKTKAYWDYDKQSEDYGMLFLVSDSIGGMDWLCHREMKELANVLNKLLEEE